MLYSFCKLLIRIAVELFFRKKYVQNLQALNTGKPLLVCANHCNSFLDAMIIMVLSKRKYHVLVRADVFKKKWVDYILRKLNLVPIYRMKDGYDQLERNNETFEEIIHVLENKGAVIIFPEASCFSEKKLRKISKGAAKVVFMAEEKYHFNLNVEVVSVGINYERLDRFGGYLHLVCGKPFAVKDYRALYEEDKNKAYKEVTDRIEKELKENMIIIDQKENEDLFDKTVILDQNMEKDFQRLQTFAAHMEDADHQKTQEYFSLLNKYKITHSTVQEVMRKKNKEQRTKSKESLLSLFFTLCSYKNILRLIDIIILFPVFVAGFIFNGIPFYLPLFISRSVFKSEREFDSSINVAGSALLFLLFYLIYFIVFSIKFGVLSGLVMILLIAMSGLIAFVYRKEFLKLVKSVRFHLLDKDIKEKIATLAIG
jgi:1-acyl-sn-glycerol-3-phosphate acyltransferase